MRVSGLGSCHCCGSKFPTNKIYFADFVSVKKYKKTCFICWKKFKDPSPDWIKEYEPNIRKCMTYSDPFIESLKPENLEYFESIQFSDLSASEMLIYINILNKKSPYL